jgi:hypothetical protein
MQTLPTDYSHAQLVDALSASYEFYLHDDYQDGDLSVEDYTKSLQTLTHSALIRLANCDDAYTIQEFMHAWS